MWGGGRGVVWGEGAAGARMRETTRGGGGRAGGAGVGGVEG